MKWKDEDLPALRQLESTVLQIWSDHEEMNDYTAGRAFDGAYQFYRSRSRGREPKPSTLNGLDLETLKAVLEVCEKLLPERLVSFDV